MSQCLPIDRQARNRAAEALRRLISGQISNDAFEDAVPESTDPAIQAIWETTWCLYSDTWEYRLTGAKRPHPMEHREALRWILFLDSDDPYVWPRRAWPGFARPHAGAGSIWWFKRRRAREFLAAGEFDAWPFARRAHFKRALRRPKRLSGGSDFKRRSR